MEHRYAIDVGSCLYRDAGLESVDFGVGDCDRSSSFFVQRIVSASRAILRNITHWVLDPPTLHRFQAKVGL